MFLDRSGPYANSDEEDGYESPGVRRRAASVDDFLKGSELGKPVSAGWVPGGGAGRARGPRPQEPQKDGEVPALVAAVLVGVGFRFNCRAVGPHWGQLQKSVWEPPSRTPTPPGSAGAEPAVG